MNIDRMRREIRDAEQLSASVVRLLEGATVPEGLESAVARVKDQAGRVAAATRDPYVLGVLGEFSAGKTMFVASLLGLVQGLVVGDQPTTGNVTAFWLRQGAPGSSTRVTGSRVTYLSSTEIADCRQVIGTQLRAAATGQGAPTRHGFEAALAENLPQVSRLKPMLAAVAHDGGREAVLVRPRDRLAEYGLIRRHERVQREHRRLDEALDGLGRRLEEPSLAGKPSTYLITALRASATLVKLP